MFEKFGDLSDWIDARVRQITRETDAELLRALGIKEAPEEVILMVSKPSEDIVEFIRKEDWSMIKALPRNEVDKEADEIVRRIRKEIER